MGALNDPAQSAIEDYIGGPEARQYPANSVKKKAIDRKVGLMVARDFQPYQIVENAGFRELLEEIDPCYHLMCRQTLTNTIVPELFQLCKVATIGILEGIMHVGLSFDGWTSNAGVAFVGVTAHFLDAEWVMRKVFIDLIQLADISEDANTVASIIIA